MYLLFVDENFMSSEEIQESFGRVAGGTDVLNCYSEKTLLKVAEQLSPQIIIVDLHMVKSDITGLFGSLRSKAQGAYILSLVEPGQYDKLYNAIDIGGVDDYLVKPISKGDFVARVQIAVRKKQTDQPDLRNLQTEESDSSFKVPEFDYFSDVEQETPASEPEITEESLDIKTDQVFSGFEFIEETAAEEAVSEEAVTEDSISPEIKNIYGSSFDEDSYDIPELVTDEGSSFEDTDSGPISGMPEVQELDSKPESDFSDELFEPEPLDGDLESFAAKPNSFESEPESPEAKPDLFETEFEPSTAKPDLFETELEASTDKPDLFETEFKASTGKPDPFEMQDEEYDIEHQPFNLEPQADEPAAGRGKRGVTLERDEEPDDWDLPVDDIFKEKDGLAPVAAETNEFDEFEAVHTDYPAFDQKATNETGLEDVFEEDYLSPDSRYADIDEPNEDVAKYFPGVGVSEKDRKAAARRGAATGQEFFDEFDSYSDDDLPDDPEGIPRKSSSILMKFASVVGNTIFILLLLMMATLSFFLVQSRLTDGAPQVAGQEMYIVLSDSMKPAFGGGSLVLVEEVQPEQLQERDIIVFHSQADFGAPTTRRIVEVHEIGRLRFITRGDANNFNDPLPVLPHDVIGQVTRYVPYVGYLMDYVQTREGLILLIFVPGVLIILYELFKIFRQVSKGRGDRKDKRYSQYAEDLGD